MSAIDIASIKPIGEFMLVRKCQRPDAGLIVLPDLVKDFTNYVEILAVGGKCKHFTAEHVGGLVQCPDFADGMHCIDERGEYWMVKESIIEPIVYAV